MSARPLLHQGSFGLLHPVAARSVPSAWHTIPGGDAIQTWRAFARVPLSGSNATTSAPPVVTAHAHSSRS